MWHGVTSVQLNKPISLIVQSSTTRPVPFAEAGLAACRMLIRLHRSRAVYCCGEIVVVGVVGVVGEELVVDELPTGVVVALAAVPMVPVLPPCIICSTIGS